LIDYANSSLTLNVTYKINFVPKWVMDKANGSFAVAFLNSAGIPASAYSFKSTSQLGSCDDIFVLPHADPTWATHSNLFDWNKNFKGSIWAGCHAVSVLENLVDPNDAGRKMNFLTTTGLLPFTQHNFAASPFSNLFPGDPIAQYISKTDNAQLNGSENVYLPKPLGAWRPGAKIITGSPLQEDVPSLSPGAAAENVYGRAFDDITRGYVAYQASHNIGGSTPDQIAAQRIFFNFSLLALKDKVPPIITANLPQPDQFLAQSPGAVAVNVSGSASGGAITYQWNASVPGTFDAATRNTASTTFTPDDVLGSVPCVITCVITEPCGRVSFDAKKVIVVPRPVIHLITGIPINKTIADGCTSASLTFNIFDNNPDADGGNRTLASLGPFANGVTTSNANGTITFTPNANFKGTTSAAYTITNGVSTTAPQNINITVGDETLTPVLIQDDVSILLDKVTQIDVLANDKNNQAATGPTAYNALYIKDIPTKPTKGFAYINSNGTISYVSKNTRPTGNDVFTYLACNTTGYCAVGTISVTLLAEGCAVNEYETSQTPTFTSITLNPLMDAYIESNFDVTTNAGADPALIFSGFTNYENRPLMKFNLSAIPTNATVRSANITLTIAADFTPDDTDGSNILNPFPATIYALTRAWTEGTGTGGLGNPGTSSNDVTWTNFTTGSPWGTLGAGLPPSTTDFILTPNVPFNFTLGAANGVATYGDGTAFATPELKTLVQPWVNTPASNHGLIFVGNINSNFSAIQFHSKEGADPAKMPKLNITYSVPSCAVIPTTYAPIVYPDAVATSSALTLTISPLTNDGNYYGNTNKISLINLSAAATVNTISGTASITNSGTQILYTPSGSFVGIDSLRYTVTDQTNTITTTGTIYITVTRAAPVVLNDVASVNSNTLTTISVGGNDSDPTGGLGVPIIITAPVNGIAVVNGLTINYTPSTGFVGTDNFTYRRIGATSDACTAALSGTAVVTVTVNNQPPVGTPGHINTFACVSGSLKVVNLGSDPENGTLSATIASIPAHGTAVVNSLGNIIYTPSGTYTGDDFFTYTLTDPLTATSTAATISISVSGTANPNTAPIALADSDSTQVNQPVYTNVLLNDSDPNSDPLNLSITALGLTGPLSGTIQLMPNKLVQYTPNNNFAGTDTYQYKLSDTHPGCSGSGTLDAIATVTITVKAVATTLSGTVWNDRDKSAAPGGVTSFVNIQTLTETGTNGTGNLYVYVVNSANKILDKTPVDIDGKYLLSSVPSLTSNLKLILSNEDLTVGATLTTGSAPIGYVNTTPVTRALPTTTTTDMGPFDWGIYSDPTLSPGTIIGPASVCATAIPGTLTSTANATGGSITATGYVYQWQSSITSASTGFADIAGANCHKLCAFGCPYNYYLFQA
jgi:hypothetical protein